MSVGFPDFQRIVRWFGDPIVNAQYVWAGVDIVLGLFQTPSYKSLTIFCNPGAGDLRVHINYRSRSQFTTVTRRQTVYFRNGTSHAVTIPAAGDVIDSITMTGNVNPQTITLIVIPSNLDPWVKYGNTAGSLQYVRNVALAAAATADLFLNAFVGAARLAFSASVYPCAVRVSGLDHTGAEALCAWENPAVAGPVNDTLVLPPMMCHAYVTNNTAGAITYSLSIVAELKP